MWSSDDTEPREFQKMLEFLGRLIDPQLSSSQCEVYFMDLARVSGIFSRFYSKLESIDRFKKKNSLRQISDVLELLRANKQGQTEIAKVLD